MFLPSKYNFLYCEYIDSYHKHNILVSESYTVSSWKIYIPCIFFCNILSKSESVPGPVLVSSETDQGALEQATGRVLRLRMPDCYEKSDARRQKNCIYRTLQNTNETHFHYWRNGSENGWILRDKKTCSCQSERLSLKCCTKWSNFAKIPNTRRAEPNHFEIS